VLCSVPTSGCPCSAFWDIGGHRKPLKKRRCSTCGLGLAGSRDSDSPSPCPTAKKARAYKRGVTKQHSGVGTSGKSWMKADYANSIQRVKQFMVDCSANDILGLGGLALVRKRTT
jgi:hypothetical protein